MSASSFKSLMALAAKAMSSGNAVESRAISIKLLDFAGRTEEERQKNKRKSDAAENEPDAKRREQIAQARRTAQLLMDSANLIELSDAVPKLLPGQPAPTIGQFLAAVRAYADAYARYSGGKKGAGIFIRSVDAVNLGNGTYQYDVFLPILSAAGNVVEYQHRSAPVNSEGNLTNTSAEPGIPVTADDVFQQIGSALAEANTIHSVNLNFDFASIPHELSSAGSMELKRTLFSVDFQDSKATRDLAANTPKEQFVALLETLATDRNALPKGEEKISEFKALTFAALQEITSAKFVVRIAGGFHSKRTFAMRRENNQIVFRVAGVGVEISFDDFMRDAFPRQLFVQAASGVPPPSTSGGDDDDETFQVTSDFANTSFGRDLEVTMSIDNTRLFDVLKISLAPAGSAAAATAASAATTSTALQGIVQTSVVEPLDVEKAAKDFASAGVATLENGDIVAFPKWTSHANAVATVANDNQVTGIADDANEVAIELNDIAHIGADKAAKIKRAFVMVANLAVLEDVEQLSYSSFVNGINDVFEIVVDDMKRLLRLTVTYKSKQRDLKIDSSVGTDPSAKRLSIWDVQSDVEDAKPTYPLIRIVVTLTSSGNVFSREFTDARFIDSPRFASNYLDVNNKIAYVGIKRENRLQYLSTQFPYDPDNVKPEITVNAWQSLDDDWNMPIEEVVTKSPLAAWFSLDGRLYSTIRQFEEASRFQGWPAVMEEFFRPLWTGDTHGIDEEYRLCLRVIEGEETVKAAGGVLIRQAFDVDEFKRAVIERVLQNEWVYQRFSLLMAEQENLKFAHMPRIVLRYDPEIGIPQYSVETRVSASAEGLGLFHIAMEELKNVRNQHIAEAMALKTRNMLRLPCPQVLVDRPTITDVENTLRVSFSIATENSIRSHLLFDSERIKIPATRVKSVLWKNPGAHLANRPRISEEVRKYLKTHEKEDCVVLNSYSSMFSLMRNKKSYNSVGEMLRSVTRPSSTFSDVGTLGDIEADFGVPALTVEVKLTIEGHDVDVFRGVAEDLIGKKETDFVNEPFMLNQIGLILNDPKYPAAMDILYAFDAETGLLSVESYHLEFPDSVAEFVNKLRNPQVPKTLLQRAVEQPDSLPRTHTSSLEENSQQSEDVLDMYDRITKQTSDPTPAPTPSLPEFDRNMFSKGAVSTPAKPELSAKDLNNLTAFVEEGDEMQDVIAEEATEKTSMPPPPSVKPGAAAKKSRKAVAVKKVVGHPRIALKQTNASLVSAPLEIEISDHGYEKRGVTVGYRARSEEDLDQTIQAVFLHPSYPTLIPAANLYLEPLLNSVAKMFTELMPRRSVQVFGQLSKKTSEFLNQVEEMSRAVQSAARAEIAALKEEYAKKKKAGTLSTIELATLKRQTSTKIERVQGDAEKKIETERREMQKNFNTKHGKPTASKKKGGADDDGGKSGDTEEALSYFLDKELSDEVPAEYAPSDFIFDGVYYKDVREFFDSFYLVIPQGSTKEYTPIDVAKAMSFALRTRVMQNRALYLSLLKMASVVVTTSNQAKLELMPSFGINIPASALRTSTFSTVRWEWFFESEDSLPKSALGTRRDSMVVLATRVRLGADLQPVNVQKSALVMATDRITAILGDRKAFFERSETLRFIEKLILPVIVTEVIIEKPEVAQSTTTATTTTTTTETTTTTTENPQAKGGKAKKRGGKEKPAGEKPKRTTTKKELTLNLEAVSAGIKLSDLLFANIDFCVAEDTATAYGVLVGGFVDHPEEKSHSYEVIAVEAVDDEIAARLLDFAEHALKYVDVSKGNGRKDSRAVDITVIEVGFENAKFPQRSAALKRVMNARKYRRMNVNGVFVWKLDIDSIQDRVHYYGTNPFSMMHLGWIENDVVSRTEWDEGLGRTFPLVVNGELRQRTVKDEEGVDFVEEIRVWREAPHPFFVPAAIEFPLQKKLDVGESEIAEAGAISTTNQSVEPATFFTVTCYAVDDNYANRKLLYRSDSAPDWIKLNGEVALLPFTNRFSSFLRNYPETIEERSVIAEEGGTNMVIIEQYRLQKDLDTLLGDFKKRREATALPEGDDPDAIRLVGATEEEKAVVAKLDEALLDLAEGIEYVNNDAEREETAMFVNYNPKTHIEWGVNNYLLETAKVQFSEPRIGPTSITHDIGDFLSLVKVWSVTKTWDKLNPFATEAPLKRQYNVEVLDLARQNGAPSWRINLLSRAEKNRWRAFMSKYTVPQPFTTLSSMLVFARESAKRIVFEVEEHTLCGNEVAPPRVVFRSKPVAVSDLFEQTLPYSKRLRIQRRADRELDETQANTVVREVDVVDEFGKTVKEKETLEQFETEDIFVRNLHLENEMQFDDIEVASNLYPGGAFKASVYRANDVRYLDVELSNEIDEEDAPERAAIGAFFIGSRPRPGEFVNITEDTSTIAALRAETEALKKTKVSEEHGGGVDDDNDDEEDEDFEGGEEESESEGESGSEGEGEEEGMALDKLSLILERM
jgi:hypothetical protein